MVYESKKSNLFFRPPRLSLGQPDRQTSKRQSTQIACWVSGSAAQSRRKTPRCRHSRHTWSEQNREQKKVVVASGELLFLHRKNKTCHLLQKQKYLFALCTNEWSLRPALTLKVIRRYSLPLPLPLENPPRLFNADNRPLSSALPFFLVNNLEKSTERVG